MMDKLGPFELNTIATGNALDLAKQLPDNSIHAIMTSPPYLGLRDYKTTPVYWPQISYSPMAGLPEITVPEQEANLGLEADLWAYVGHLVAIFRELRRALRGDGTLWLNLGDSYSSGFSGQSGDNPTSTMNNPNWGAVLTGRRQPYKDLPMKNLMAIPWRVALALQADGWYLRSDVIWAKPNPMPESVSDRPTKAHEYLFLLAKSGRYYYDQEAVREAAIDYGSAEAYKSRIGKKRYHEGNSDPAGGGFRGNGGFQASPLPTNGRNRRTVWTIATQPFPEAHFATFPEKLIEPCILASTSEYGCCAECGSPYERIIEKQSNYQKREQAHVPNNCSSKVDSSGWSWPTVEYKGWQPTCKCNTDKIVPAVVLDPFIGSGTTGRVAIKNRRNFIGFELNETYAQDLASDRLDGVQIQMMV